MDTTNQDSPISPKAKWDAFVTCPDEDFFKEVFDCFYPRLHGYGMKLCGQPNLVEDCLQDLFKDVWRRRHDLEHVRSPRVYLLVALRRITMKALKNQRSSSELSELDKVEPLQFSREELIIKDEVKFEQKKELQWALNQLPKRQREVIYLYYYQGMSYQEIQQIMSIRHQSVCNHMHRAMEGLRGLLDYEIMRRISSVLLFVGLCSLTIMI